MKKWLVFILLLITTASTFIPCCQVDGCPADQLASPSNNENDEQEGGCSPFFACTTCQGFVVLERPIQLVQPEVTKQVHHSKVISILLSTYTASLFQPPRVP